MRLLICENELPICRKYFCIFWNIGWVDIQMILLSSTSVNSDYLSNLYIDDFDNVKPFYENPLVLTSNQWELVGKPPAKESLTNTFQILNDLPSNFTSTDKLTRTNWSVLQSSHQPTTQIYIYQTESKTFHRYFHKLVHWKSTLFQRRSLLTFLTTASLCYFASTIWTCAEPKFWL